MNDNDHFSILCSPPGQEIVSTSPLMITRAPAAGAGLLLTKAGGGDLIDHGAGAGPRLREGGGRGPGEGGGRGLGRPRD